MKKIMVALGAVAIAFIANAASFSWKADNDSLFLPGQEDDYASGLTVYLLNAASFTQQDALTAFAADKTSLSGKAIDSSTVNSSGGISNKTFDYAGQAAGTTWQAYFAIVNGDNVFISDLSRTIAVPAIDATTAISIGDQFDNSTAALTQSSTFGGAGWYAVPEPTSGLLMLLGMAGLALRRKRA